LTPRKCKVSELRVLANEEQDIAFDLGLINEKRLDGTPGEDAHLIVLTRERFDELVAESGKKSPFKWAPGLVGDDMNREEFVETLQLALE